MSRVRKKRENQVYIKDVDEWMATVGKPGLLVAELYAPHFGPCETMFPVIDEIMTSLDNVDRGDEVRWAIVNVSKLEDDKAAANAEDALKRQETKGCFVSNWCHTNLLTVRQQLKTRREQRWARRSSSQQLPKQNQKTTTLSERYTWIPQSRISRRYASW